MLDKEKRALRPIVHRAIVLAVAIGLSTAGVMVLPGGPTAFGENAAAPAPSQSEQFPWPFQLQLQHDRPLVVEGRVLDSAGKPVEKAHVALIAVLVDNSLRVVRPQVLGETTSGAKGAFRATVPSVPAYQCLRVVVVARRAGYGFSFDKLDPADLEHEVTFRLRDEQPVRGRVVDQQGQPASGVQLCLSSFGEKWSRTDYKGCGFALRPAQQATAWPPPVTSDEAGRFVLRGIPRSSAPELSFRFEVDDPRYAPEAFYSVVPSDGSEEVAIRLSEPRIVEGTVICKETKKPIPGVWLKVASNDIGWTCDLQGQAIAARTDDRGRFRVSCRPKKYAAIYVYPPRGMPYPDWVESKGPWTADALRQEVTVEVPLGVLLRGKVVEAGSLTPVEGASVEYQIRWKSPHFSEKFTRDIYWAAEYRQILSAADGTFEMGVMPGPGHLLVKAPNPDFVSRVAWFQDFQYPEPGMVRYGLEGLARIDPQSGSKELEVTVPLRRGLTVRGRVVGPQGEVVRNAVLLSHSYSRVPHINSQSLMTIWPRPVRDGRFELRGCDPEEPQRVFFLEVEHQWGAAVSLDSAQAQSEPPVIRLLPCVSATARFVDQDGQPWADYSLEGGGPPIFVDLVAVKDQAEKRIEIKRGDVTWPLRRLDPKRHGPLRTDAEGRVTFPTIIPGTLHRVLFSQWMEKKGVRFNLHWTGPHFTVEPGQNLDLGDITVKRYSRE